MKFPTKLTAFFLLCIYLLPSCKTLDRISYGKAPMDPITQKILPLEKKDFGIEKYDTDIIDNNICEVNGEKYGYIILTKQVDSKIKGFWSSYLLNIFTLGVPWVLGMPFYSISVTINIDYEIQNSKKERIAKFSGTGSGKATSALYYGYSTINAATKASYDALNLANKNIRLQLTPSVVENINSQLKAKGPL